MAGERRCGRCRTVLTPPQPWATTDEPQVAAALPLGDEHRSDEACTGCRPRRTPYPSGGNARQPHRPAGHVGHERSARDQYTESPTPGSLAAMDSAGSDDGGDPVYQEEHSLVGRVTEAAGSVDEMDRARHEDEGDTCSLHGGRRGTHLLSSAWQWDRIVWHSDNVTVSCQPCSSLRRPTGPRPPARSPLEQPQTQHDREAEEQHEERPPGRPRERACRKE